MSIYINSENTIGGKKMKEKCLLKKLIAISLSAFMSCTAIISMPCYAYDDNAPEAVVSQKADIGTAIVRDECSESSIYESPDYPKAPACPDYKLDGIVIANSRNPYLTGGNEESSDESNISWSVENGTLTITGTGDMENYEYQSYAPWYSERYNVTNIVIGEGITSIGKFAFYNFTKVVSVTVPSTITKVSSYIFAEAHALKSVTLPDAVTSLPYAAFASCYNLESFTANGLTMLGDYSLSSTKLKSFRINSKLTSISNTAFFQSSIEEFIVDSDNTVYSAVDGVLYKDHGKTLFLYPCNKADESFIIPSEVTNLAESSFLDAKLKKVIIPDSVESMGYFVFSRSALTDVKFGKGLKEISYECFENCYDLKNIDFGSGVESIANRAFCTCTSLETLVLPENIKEISSASFGECTSLKSVSVSSLEVIPYQAFMSCYALTDIQINNVKSINRAAFAYCRSIDSITLPESVTYVHPYAFYRSDGNKTKITCLNSEMKPFGYNGYRRLQTVSIKSDRKYDLANEVLDIVNTERANNNLDPVVMNESLLESAMIRAGECALNFSHTRPDSSSVFELNSLISGENIAYGDTTAEGVMSSWMKSSGHKQNILSEDFTTIGIGCIYHNGIYYWTQCFGTGDDSEDCAIPKNNTVTQSISFAIEKFTDAATGTGVSYSFGGGGTYYFEDFYVTAPSELEEEQTASATVYLSNAYYYYCKAKLENDSNIKWTSSDKAVATVSNAGVIKGVKAGSADITAKADYFSATTAVKVNKKIIYPEKVTLNKSALNIEVGKSYMLNATITPADSDDLSVTWSTDNSGVATVDNGRVRAIAPGTANITVRTSNGKTAVCKVTVTDKLVNTSWLNAEKVQIGDDIRVTGEAEGGAGGYKYAFYFKRSANSKWNKIGEEFGAKTYGITVPKAAADYDMKVIVKDSAGNTAQKIFKVTVVESLPLTNISLINTPTEISVGKTVTIAGRQVGGAKPFTYEFYFKRSANSKWNKLSYGSDKHTYAKFTPTTAAEYDLKAVVIDSKGTKAEKIYKITAK